MARRQRPSSSGRSVVPLGAPLVAVVCCAGLPVLTAAFGGLTLAAVLGIGAGGIAAAAATVFAVIVVRGGRRRGRAARGRR